MKQNIDPGVYGWRHSHWLNSFYPEDLPVEGRDDWRLTYYSNEFNAVLVPASYWQVNEKMDCESWLDAVHEDFKFFVECHVNMLDFISVAELEANLKQLQPQLSALVFVDDKQLMSASVKKQFDSLIDALAVDVFGLEALAATSGLPQNKLWRDKDSDRSNFALIENDLTDLRAVKNIVEDFALQLEEAAATIIVNHPRLQASDLSKFRSMLEIMGY